MVGGNPSVGGGGFAASPAGTAPLYYKSAEIASGSAKNLCKKSEDVGGCAFFAACYPLPLPSFLPPIPPTPFPGGEGGDFRLFHARGFAPCIPATEPARHWFALPLWKTQWGGLPRRCRRGGRQRYPAGGLPGWSPAYPAFTFFSAPYPPDPLPRRGRGRPRLFHARGFAPCIPATEPARHSQSLPSRYPAEGLPSLPPAYPAFTFFSAPYPPSPLPQRGRGCPKVYFAGGFAPGTPAFNRLRHLQNLPSRCPKWGFASCETGLRRRSDTLRRCAFGVASSAQNR